MKHLGMAGTYVQIDRDELESWLNGLPHLTGKAQRVPGRAGVYVLPLSDFVGVRLSSTIGSSDDAVERGKASMQLALVSLITGQVLNKKAQGQSHFKRTVNWKTTWKEGIDRMREAYTKSQGFYDGVARIHDRNAYKADVLKAIDEIPNWQENGILSDFRVLVDRGGILTLTQEELLNRTLDAEERKLRAPAPVAPAAEPAMLNTLRELYVRARKSGDQWLMEFTESVGKQLKGGRPLSPKQQEVIERNMAKFRMASSIAARYLSR